MSTQTHHIKSLLIELEVERETQARQLQADMSQVWRAQIMPLLERCFNETDRAGTRLRIDSLELDLGTIEDGLLTEETLVRLERQLRSALEERRDATSGGAAPDNTDIQASLEVLAVYARNGCLTWPANPAQGDPINNSLEQLLQGAPAELVRTMRKFAKDERSLTRIVNHCDDRMLSQLGALAVALKAATVERFSLDLLEIVQKATAHAGFPARVRERRKLVWTAILRIAYRAASPSQGIESLWRNVLAQLAELSQSRYDKLVTELLVTVEKNSVIVSDDFHELLDKLNKEVLNARVAATDAGAGFRNAAAAETLHKHSVTESRKRWAIVLQMLERMQSAGEDGDSQAVNALRDLADTLIRERCPPPPGFAERLHQFDALFQTLFDAGKKHRFETLIQDHSGKGRLDTGLSDRLRKQETHPLESVFDDPEEAYVENAGLVLLWPFLQRFFGQLELLEDKRFKDAEAAQRGVGLLQYLATEDAAGPEYFLPLNKVLCGLEPADGFDFGLPVSQTERDECIHMLEAVIEHASILRKMSIQGLRGTFLLRKGILGSRDGAWLLRVERESYDVVLERFPWSFNWVKLPWMNAPMCVEW